LAAVLVERHRGGGGDVVAVGQSPGGDLDHVIQECEHFVGETRALVADYERRLALELVVVDVDRVGGLFQAHQMETLLLETFEHRWQGAVSHNANRVGTVAGDAAFQLGRARADNFIEAATTGRPGDPREIDVAPHRSTHEQQWPRLGKLAGWLVALVLEQVWYSPLRYSAVKVKLE